MTRHEQRAEDEILGSTETADEQARSRRRAPGRGRTELARDMRAEGDFELDVEVLTAKAAERDELSRARPAHPGRLRELPQARGARAAGAAEARGVGAARARAAARRSTTSSARSRRRATPRRRRAAARGPAARAARAGRARSSAPASSRYGEPRRAVRPRRPRGGRQRAADGVAAGVIVEVYQPGYQLRSAR